MEFYGDYHTHTYYSDGHGSIEDSIKAAIKKGLKEVCISDHGFSCPNALSLSYEKFQKQKKEIEELRKKYKEITIYHSIETNVINFDGEIDAKREVIGEMDILLAGFHKTAVPNLKDWYKYVLKGFLSLLIKPSEMDIKKNTKSYIELIKNYDIDILTHPNNVLKIDVIEVAKACADYGTYYEVNSKYLGLIEEDIEKVLQTDVTLIANTDAHRSNRVGDFEDLKKTLEKMNVDPKRVANWGKKPEFRSRR